MKKHLKLNLLFAGILLTASLASCGNDNDDPKPKPNPNQETETVEANPANVFPLGLPKKMGEFIFTTNEKGQLLKVEDGETVVDFYYDGSKPSNTTKRKAQANYDYDVTMVINDKEIDETTTFYMKLNKQGFVEKACEVYEENGITEYDEWNLTYNADGQLLTMKRSEGGNEITTINYRNGDIERVEMTNDDGEKKEFVIAYTDATTKSAITNTCGMMFFDLCFAIDMDEMEWAYYAGILGKATTHLPVSCTDSDGDLSLFSWTLDAKNRPTKLTFTEYNNGEKEFRGAVTFQW